MQGVENLLNVNPQVGQQLARRVFLLGFGLARQVPEDRSEARLRRRDSAWAVYVDNSRLDGEGGRFSACLPASVKIRFSAPKVKFIVRPQHACLNRENALDGS